MQTAADKEQHMERWTIDYQCQHSSSYVLFYKCDYYYQCC